MDNKLRNIMECVGDSDGYKSLKKLAADCKDKEQKH